MMTANERAMVIEIAKGVAALGRAVETLAERLPMDAIRMDVTNAASEAEESLREFMRLVDVEWLETDE